MTATHAVRGAMVLVAGAIAAVVVSAPNRASSAVLPAKTIEAGAASVTIYAVPHPRGVLATSGGWAYCQQVRALASHVRDTLLCGKFSKDGYVGPGLRALRHEDWGNAAYLSDLATVVERIHRGIGGKLILIGVSYSGFGVATLASHHPELRPDRLIVIDSYLDLVARRRHSPDGSPTAVEIDAETGGSVEELQRRSVQVEGLAQLVRSGTELVPIWTTSAEERRFYRGATCDRTASARTIAELARRLAQSVPVWITSTKHGHNLWHHGREIMRGHYPGTKVVFQADGQIPPAAVC